MPRSTTALFKSRILAQKTGAAFVVLLEVSHPSEPEPFRVCLNNEPVTRLGQIWNPAWFDIALPAEQPERLSQVTLTIENISRELLDLILSLPSPPSVSVWVSAMAPGEVDDDGPADVGPFEFSWTDTSYDATAIRATLSFEDLLNERYVRDEFVPSKFRGLFR